MSTSTIQYYATPLLQDVDPSSRNGTTRRTNLRQLSQELQLEDDATTTTTTTIHQPKPQIIGHRGSLYDAVENSLESFQACFDVGSHGIELDVFLLQDGTLVVFHGSGTDETPGYLFDYCHYDDIITNLTYEETQALTFVRSDMIPLDPRNTKGLQVKIPTLEQVLRHFRGTSFQIKIELKGQGTVVPTLELVEQLQMQHQCTYSSFYHDRLQELRHLRPNKELYPTGAIFKGQVPHDFIQRSIALGVSEIHLRYDTCTKSRIRAIHNAGFQSMAWFRGPKAMKSDMMTFEDVESEQHLYELVARTGVQQLCVNRPALAMDMLKDL